MTSKEFFGNFKFKDINVKIENDKGVTIYQNDSTTFANVKPIIKEEIQKVIDDYRKRWQYNGEPYRVILCTTPSWNCCIYYVQTKQMIFQ